MKRCWTCMGLRIICRPSQIYRTPSIRLSSGWLGLRKSGRGAKETRNRRGANRLCTKESLSWGSPNWNLHRSSSRRQSKSLSCLRTTIRQWLLSATLSMKPHTTSHQSLVNTSSTLSRAQSEAWGITKLKCYTRLATTASQSLATMIVVLSSPSCPICQCLKLVMPSCALFLNSQHCSTSQQASTPSLPDGVDRLSTSASIETRNTQVTFQLRSQPCSHSRTRWCSRMDPTTIFKIIWARV